MTAQVLVADDEALIRQSLRAALAGEGFDVSVAASGAEAWQRFVTDRPDVVVLDLVLGDADGMELLERMKREAPETKVLVVTAFGTIKSAVAAMKLGGYDFIKKPFELDEVIAAVRNASRTSSLERQVEYLVGRERRRSQPSGMVYVSERMRRLAEEVAVIAASPVPVVLVTGESGTGKQLVARMLHDRAASARAAGPFVELNCSAIPESLVESELFGHERGAFSDARERKLGLVEIADGGTLFLDEVGDLGQAAQAKLLTFLEQRTFRRVGSTVTRRVDARIVAATNRDLADMVQRRTFREDLFYRLNAIPVRLPPLRDRPDDIPALAEHFLREASAQFQRRFQALAKESVEPLRRHPWPGNVRELRAVVSRAALLHDDVELRPEHLPEEVRAAQANASGGASLRASMVVATTAATTAAPERRTGEHREVATAAAGGRPPIPTLAEVELDHIRSVLERCGGNRTLAAQHLGITRQTLAKKIGSAEAAGEE